MYTAFLLDKISINKLKRLEIRKTDEWKPYIHHVTLNLGNCPEKYQKYLDKEFLFKVTDIGYDDNIICVKVEILTDIEFEFKNAFSHVTMYTLNGEKPYKSNFIKNFEPIEPIFIKGKLTELN